MTTKRLIVALAFLVSISSSVMAQSQPNRGPAGNRGGDSYGEIYSGTAQARQQSGE